MDRLERDQGRHRRGGQGIAVQGFLVDITDCKHAEAQLLEAGFGYRTLVEQLPLVTFTLTVDGRLDWISPQVEEMFDRLAELVAGGIDMFGLRVHPDDAHVKATLLTWLRDGMPQHSVSAARYRVRHADGHWVWVTSTAQVIRAEDGTPLEVQGFMLDISNLVSAEEEIGARLKEGSRLGMCRAVARAGRRAPRGERGAHPHPRSRARPPGAAGLLAHFIPGGRAGVFLLDGRAPRPASVPGRRRERRSCSADGPG